VTIAQMERACHPQDYGEITEDDDRRWPNVTEPVAKRAAGLMSMNS
jgi:hypothetical protein